MEYVYSGFLCTQSGSAHVPGRAEWKGGARLLDLGLAAGQNMGHRVGLSRGGSVGDKSVLRGI